MCAVVRDTYTLLLCVIPTAVGAVHVALLEVCVVVTTIRNASWDSHSSACHLYSCYHVALLLVCVVIDVCMSSASCHTFCLSASCDIMADICSITAVTM